MNTDEEIASTAVPSWETYGPEFDWLNDQGYFQGPEVAAEISAEDRRFAFSAEGAYLALCLERTGALIPDEKVAEIRAAAAELLRQSHAIAEKLESNGVKAYRETPFGLYRYYVFSGHVEKLPSFRRKIFVPTVACQVRAPMLAALESFLERYPFARFLTFTSGSRVTLAEVRDRAQWLHRKISELNAQPFMREFGLSIVFRSTELGTPEADTNGVARPDAGEIERDESGRVSFHVHAHCVAVLGGFLAPERWKTLLGHIHAFWPHHWQEGGQIRDARECCKYVTKPGEMLKLTGEELVSLHTQLSRLKLVQPMGALAAEMRARKKERRRLVKKHTPEGLVFRDVNNWNSHARRTKTEKAADAVEKLAQGDGTGGPRLLCRLTPGFGPSGIMEPRVVMMAQKWNEAAVRNHPAVTRLIVQTEDAFQRGASLRYTYAHQLLDKTMCLDLGRSEPLAKHVLTAVEQIGASR